MEDKLNKVREIIRRPKNTASGYLENYNSIIREIREIIDVCSYKELMSLTEEHKYKDAIYTTIYLYKKDLGKDEIEELIKIIKDNSNFSLKTIERCNIKDSEYIDMLTMVLNKQKKTYTDIWKLRAYNLFDNTLNKDSIEYLNYEKELTSGRMLMVKDVVEYISEFEEEEKRHKLFEALLNREDYIRYLFCNDVEIVIPNEKNEMRTILDVKVYSEEDIEMYGLPFAKTGIYLNSVMYFNVRENELKEIYDKYRYLLFNRKKEYYYSNCMIFVDYIGKEDKIEFVNRLTRTDNINRIKKVLGYSKFEDFLDREVESKDKLEAVLLMNVLSN